MMKRLLVVALLLAVIGTTAAFAQDQPAQYQQGGGYGYGYGMGPGRMQGGRGYGRGIMHAPTGGPCIGCMVACVSMVMPRVTATVDGGVVVAIGGKLIKYDTNLKKVAEITIQIDWTEVQRRVEQIVQNCPIHRRMYGMRAPFQWQPPRQFQGQPQSRSQGQ